MADPTLGEERKEVITRLLANYYDGRPSAILNQCWEEALRQAAGLLCEGCREEWPLNESPTGPWHRVPDSFNPNVRCLAGPIRRLLDAEGRP